MFPEARRVAAQSAGHQREHHPQGPTVLQPLHRARPKLVQGQFHPLHLRPLTSYLWPQPPRPNRCWNPRCRHRNLSWGCNLTRENLWSPWVQNCILYLFIYFFLCVHALDSLNRHRCVPLSTDASTLRGDWRLESFCIILPMPALQATAKRHAHPHMCLPHVPGLHPSPPIHPSPNHHHFPSFQLSIECYIINMKHTCLDHKNSFRLGGILSTTALR